MIDPKTGNQLKRRVKDWGKIKFDVPRFIEENIGLYFKYRMNKADRLIFAYLLLLNTRFKRLMPSQVNISQLLNYCETTINRRLKVLEVNKLILSNSRGLKRSKYYRIAPFFKNLEIKEFLNQFLKYEIEAIKDKLELK